MASNDMSYEEAAHAMQSGVAAEMKYRSEPTMPKHLRVGVNAAMADQAGLVTLLIEKGLITDAEYREAVRVSMVAEVRRYENFLRQLTGADITLG